MVEVHIFLNFFCYKGPSCCPNKTRVEYLCSSCVSGFVCISVLFSQFPEAVVTAASPCSSSLSLRLDSALTPWCLAGVCQSPCSLEQHLVWLILPYVSWRQEYHLLRLCSTSLVTLPSGQHWGHELTGVHKGSAGASGKSQCSTPFVSEASLKTPWVLRKVSRQKVNLRLSCELQTSLSTSVLTSLKYTCLFAHSPKGISVPIPIWLNGFDTQVLEPQTLKSRAKVILCEISDPPSFHPAPHYLPPPPQTQALSCSLLFLYSWPICFTLHPNVMVLFTGGVTHALPSDFSVLTGLLLLEVSSFSLAPIVVSLEQGP